MATAAVLSADSLPRDVLLPDTEVYYARPQRHGQSPDVVEAHLDDREDGMIQA